MARSPQLRPEAPSMRLLRSLLPLALTCLVFAVAGAAAGALEIPVTIEKNRFQPDEIKVKAGTPFVLVVTNKDANPEEFESKELRIEKVIPGGKTLTLGGGP